MYCILYYAGGIHPSFILNQIISSNKRGEGETEREREKLIKNKEERWGIAFRFG